MVLFSQTAAAEPFALEDHLLPAITPSSAMAGYDPLTNLKAVCRRVSIEANVPSAGLEFTPAGAELREFMEKAVRQGGFQRYIHTRNEDMPLEIRLNPVFVRLVNLLAEEPEGRYALERARELQRSEYQAEPLLVHLTQLVNQFELDQPFQSAMGDRRFLSEVADLLFHGGPERSLEVLRRGSSSILHESGLHGDFERQLEQIIACRSSGELGQRENSIALLVACEALHYALRRTITKLAHERSADLCQRAQTMKGPDDLLPFGRKVVVRLTDIMTVRGRTDALRNAVLDRDAALADPLALLFGFSNEISTPESMGLDDVPADVSKRLMSLALRAVADRNYGRIPRLAAAAAICYPEAIDEESYDCFPDLVTMRGAFPHTAPIVAAAEGLIEDGQALTMLEGKPCPPRYNSWGHAFRSERAEFAVTALRAGFSGVFRSLGEDLAVRALGIVGQADAPAGPFIEEGPRKPVVLLTGVSSGIGLALGKRLKEETPYRIVATARRHSLSKLPVSLTIESDRFLVRPLDVTAAREREAVVQEIRARWEGVDILVNNAGTCLRGVGEQVSPAEMHAQLDVNYVGPMALTQLVLPHMRELRRGKIINVSSMSGVMAMPTMGQYSASKFALEGGSEALYYELKPWNINVTLVQPGFVRSDSFLNVHWAQAAKASVIEGDSYSIYYSKMVPFIERQMRRAWATPHSIAGSIMEVMDDPSPPLRKAVSLDGYVFSALRRVMPRAAYHWLLYRCLPGVRQWGRREE